MTWRSIAWRVSRGLSPFLARVNDVGICASVALSGPTTAAFVASRTAFSPYCRTDLPNDFWKNVSAASPAAARAFLVRRCLAMPLPPLIIPWANPTPAPPSAKKGSSPTVGHMRLAAYAPSANSAMSDADCRVMSPIPPMNVTFCRASCSFRNRDAYSRSWSVISSPDSILRKVFWIPRYSESGMAIDSASPNHGMSSSLKEPTARFQYPCGPLARASSILRNSSPPWRARRSASRMGLPRMLTGTSGSGASTDAEDLYTGPAAGSPTGAFEGTASRRADGDPIISAIVTYPPAISNSYL